MKFLSLIATVATILFLSGCSSSKSVTKNMDYTQNFIGTWQIATSDGELDTNLYGRQNETSLKIFSSKDFSVNSIHLINRKVLKSFVGTYTVDNETITEYIEYKSDGYPLISSQIYRYKYRIENDLLYIQGMDNNFSEVWKKIK